MDKKKAATAAAIIITLGMMGLTNILKVDITDNNNWTTYDFLYDVNVLENGRNITCQYKNTLTYNFSELYSNTTVMVGCIRFSIKEDGNRSIWIGDPATRKFKLMNNSGGMTENLDIRIKKIKEDKDKITFRIEGGMKDKEKKDLNDCLEYSGDSRKNCFKSKFKEYKDNEKGYLDDYDKIPVNVSKFKSSKKFMDVRGDFVDFEIPVDNWKDGIEVSYGLNTLYWKTVSDCDVNISAAYANETIVFTCNLNINAELNSTNVTWQWNETANNQYEINVNSGGIWASYTDTFNDYGASGYDIWIDINDKGWANLSSVESCEADLDGIRIFDGATAFIDNYYDNVRCRSGHWLIYTNTNTTLINCNKDCVEIYVDSNDFVDVYNFDFGYGALHSGNITTGDNLIKWTNSGTYYGAIHPQAGVTGDINITESYLYRISDLRSQTLNIINSTTTSYVNLAGDPFTVWMDNCRLVYPVVEGKGKFITPWNSYSNLSTNFRSNNVINLSGFYNYDNANPISDSSSGTFRINYPICLYIDSYSTPIPSGKNITLYNINDTVEEGSGLSSANGCVNVTVSNIVVADEFDTLEIRYEGVSYRNISVFSDSTETVSGVLVGFKVANVSVPATTTTITATTTTTTPATTTTTTGVGCLNVTDDRRLNETYEEVIGTNCTGVSISDRIKEIWEIIIGG